MAWKVAAWFGATAVALLAAAVEVSAATNHTTTLEKLLWISAVICAAVALGCVVAGMRTWKSERRSGAQPSIPPLPIRTLPPPDPLERDAVVAVPNPVEIQIAGHKALRLAETGAPTVTQPDKRIVVDVAPEYLASFFKEHTSVQATKLAEAYIGKWMKVSGPLGDVINTYENFAQVTFAQPSILQSHKPYFVIFMYFRGESIERLRILRRGVRITVLGQIREVQSIALHLDNCELEEP